MVKQKIVIKVQLMNTTKARSNAMKIAVGMLGVESAAIGGNNNDQIEVVGDMDPVILTNLLRKRFCRAELLSVGPVEKKEIKKEEKKEDKKEEKVVPCSCPPYYAYPAPIPMCVAYPCEEPSPCSIL
ncbi:heavy metal-associated isoprenylated plant protein 2-like [Trifolium pratense]|uniref:heavy metal-associated isoprenylated plant protein 2-like n=1 Tax=Trifolium pratense TaxID=57577 RepID=UPI001E692AC5|nr:heavy metal-associated isoprenylated plant protein 2-like [Trifolium pratense]